MSLMTCVSSSSFFLSQYLTKRITLNEFSSSELTYAVKINNVAALTLHERKSQIGSDTWLSLNKELAKTNAEAAFKLGEWYQHQAEHKGRFNKTAVMWYEQGIRLNSQESLIALADLYYQHDELKNAHNLIASRLTATPQNKYDILLVIINIKIAIHHGNTFVVTEQVNLLREYKEYFPSVKNEINTLLSQVSKFTILPATKAINTVPENTVQGFNYSDETFDNYLQHCVTSLQLFATNIEHLEHLEELIRSFKKQEPLSQMLCLTPPRYISSEVINCDKDFNKAINCNESNWQSIADSVYTRHVGLLVDEGGANVHFGILYLDTEDTVEVFSHEVSHLLGFVDEYTLVKDHDLCQGEQSKPFSHNVVVFNDVYQGKKEQLRKDILARVPWNYMIKTSTPVLQHVGNGLNNQDYWRIGTPKSHEDEVGLYRSETCDNSTPTMRSSQDNFISNLSAFKPLNKRTQLRYFSDSFPQEYLNFLEKNPTKFLMPSFHYNISLALFNQGNPEESKKWLKQAVIWNKNP